ANNRPPTIGRSIPHVRLSIRDEAHLPRPDGEEGEICISGINLARGYTDPTATAASFIADPLDPAVVLYLTGDRGYQDPDGNLVCVGRLATSTTVKVRGGWRVDLSEIEAVLLPVVAACAVVQSEAGHLLAFVVLPETRPPTVSALYDHLRTRLPSYMLPTTIIPLETLPRTASDKLDCEALRRSLANWRQLAEHGAFQGARTPVEVQVTEIVAETLNALKLGSSQLQPQEINLLKTFGELGGDSLSVAEVLLRIATVFHVDLDEELLDRLPLAQITALIDPLEG
ncbi:MAG TPA: non-ribosomal peptide synthetase, partial [Ktedonobacteraceae bacterium]|nr:non-ribosomal peptide synthetase [Ktedonobacteraceae bacterium]